MTTTYGLLATLCASFLLPACVELPEGSGEVYAAAASNCRLEHLRTFFDGSRAGDDPGEPSGWFVSGKLVGGDSGDNQDAGADGNQDAGADEKDEAPSLDHSIKLPDGDFAGWSIHHVDHEHSVIGRDKNSGDSVVRVEAYAYNGDPATLGIYEGFILKLKAGEVRWTHQKGQKLQGAPWVNLCDAGQQ